jgi:MFS family permease
MSRRLQASRRLWPFLALETATALAGIANGIATVAFPWLVLERTGNPSAAAAIGAITLLPLLATSLVSGTIVDLVGRRAVSVTSDLLSLLSVAAIPLLDGRIGLGIAALAALAVLGATFDPAGITAREAMLPDAARASGLALERANGIHEATWGVAFLVGPGVAGLLIALVGAVSTFWGTAACFGASALLLALVRVPGAGRPVAEVREEGFLGATMAGLAFLWRDRVLRSVALLAALLIGLWLPVEGVILPVYFQDRGAPGELGAVLMALSGGAVLGALAYAAIGVRIRRRTAFVGSMVGTSLAVVGMALLPPLVGLLLLGFASGALYGPINPIINIAMQERTPDALRGRVVGLITSASYVAGPAGYLVAGPLINAVGLQAAFLLFSAALVAVAVASFAVGALHGLEGKPVERVIAAGPAAR